MRILWILCAALLFFSFVSAKAGPGKDDENKNDQPGGLKTWNAIKDCSRPITNYFMKLPKKTPSEVALDIKQMPTYVKKWVNRNGIRKETLNMLNEATIELRDRTFREIYDDVKNTVLSYDEEFGAFLQHLSDKYENEYTDIDEEPNWVEQ